jgi:hypothetical protein
VDFELLAVVEPFEDLVVPLREGVAEVVAAWD